MNEQIKNVRKSVLKSNLKTNSRTASPNDSSVASHERPDKGLLDTGAELKKALDAWNELAAQAPTQSADEKLLQDVQQLLKQLKSKIEEFK